ncbi:MAG: hypothetical protein JSU70_15405 [Phycisphaerales bacterium]|nr:MAG: hypothetical protein JSU70_15405 [Phycisphaerales bacterium]
MKLLIRFLVIVLVLFLCVPRGVDAQLNGSPDIRAMARAADFIFKGRVEQVEYRNSEVVPLLDRTGAPVYEGDHPVYVDGSNLPHSFITYRLLEVYKGKPPRIGRIDSQTVTLRMLGGLNTSSVPYTIFMEVRWPHMDEGDTDVLFVLGNTVLPCPLVGNERGRFRVITDPEDNESKIYNDIGREVLYVEPTADKRDEIGFGRIHRYPEIMMYHFGDCEGCTVEKVHTDDGDEYSDPGGLGDQPPDEPALGEQFTEGRFGEFVAEIVEQMHSPAELGALPPVISADITEPFTVEPFEDDAPEDFGPEQPVVYPRPWLDELPEEERAAILEAERVEAMLLELSGGNPVLPRNECEMRILTEGAMAGDVSGPEGRPDCYVNLFDVAALAQLWLECNNPDDDRCL